MSTTTDRTTTDRTTARTTARTTNDVRRDAVRPLTAVLGLARRPLPSLHLPPLEQQLVPGGSPLEASGWTAPTDPGRPPRP